MQELSKKKPDTPLNTYKVKVINRVLEPIKELLQYEDTAPFLDILIADDMQTNSDAVLIMSQHQSIIYTQKTNGVYNNYGYFSDLHEERTHQIRRDVLTF